MSAVALAEMQRVLAIQTLQNQPILIHGADDVPLRLFLPQRALLLEELAEDGSALVLQHAADGGRLMIQPRIVCDLVQRMNGPRFGVGCSVD